MFNINKILKPRYLLVLLVLGGGALFTTMLQAAQCVSTSNGDLTEQTTFGTYQGIAQTGCGDNLTFDYLINSGTTSENGTTSTINVTLDSSAFPVAPDNASADNSTFLTITNLSGNTSENGTTSTFNVTLDSSAFPAVSYTHLTLPTNREV